MPLGNVGLAELAEAVRGQIEGSVPYLAERVFLALAKDGGDIQEHRKLMGMAPMAVTVMPADNAITMEPQLGRTAKWRFALRITVLYRRMKPLGARVAPDDSGFDLTKLTKDVMAALAGERLDILNGGGIAVSPGSIVDDSDAIQALQFTVFGSSREPRS